MEEDYFHEDARESIPSIISVLERKTLRKASENKRKKGGEHTRFHVFQVKKCETTNSSDVLCNSVEESVVVSDLDNSSSDSETSSSGDDEPHRDC